MVIRVAGGWRSDEFGGSVDNRLRFPMMVVEAVTEVWGTERTGIRVSPTGSFNDMYDDNPVSTYGAFAERLDAAGLAYIEVVEDSFQGNHAEGRPEAVIDAIRARFSRVYIANGAYTAEEARRGASRPAAPTWCPSVGPSSPTPTWWSASAWERP